MTATRIGSVSDVPDGKSKMYTVNGQPIGVFHVNGKWFAIHDRCTHRGGLLHEGYLEGETVTCPLHAGTFDLKTGQNLSPPAPSPVKTYKISVQGNDLMLDVS